MSTIDVMARKDKAPLIELVLQRGFESVNDPRPNAAKNLQRLSMRYHARGFDFWTESKPTVLSVQEMVVEAVAAVPGGFFLMQIVVDEHGEDYSVGFLMMAGQAERGFLMPEELVTTPLQLSDDGRMLMLSAGGDARLYDLRGPHEDDGDWNDTMISWPEAELEAEVNDVDGPFTYGAALHGNRFYVLYNRGTNVLYIRARSLDDGGGWTEGPESDIRSRGIRLLVCNHWPAALVVNADRMMVVRYEGAAMQRKLAYVNGFEPALMNSLRCSAITLSPGGTHLVTMQAFNAAFRPVAIKLDFSGYTRTAADSMLFFDHVAAPYHDEPLYFLSDEVFAVPINSQAGSALCHLGDPTARGTLAQYVVGSDPRTGAAYYYTGNVFGRIEPRTLPAAGIPVQIVEV